MSLVQRDVGIHVLVQESWLTAIAGCICCEDFPEAEVRGRIFHIREDAYRALIELRNLCPEIMLALQFADARRCGEPVKDSL